MALRWSSAELKRDFMDCGSAILRGLEVCWWYRCVTRAEVVDAGGEGAKEMMMELQKLASLLPDMIMNH